MSALPPVRQVYPHVVLDDPRVGGSPLVEGTRLPVRRIFQWQDYASRKDPR